MFQALIVSRLTYGLASLWLLSSQRRRLDGFYVRCLRRILRIPAAYYSRVSNVEVLRRANAMPITNLLMRRQMELFGKAALTEDESPMRLNTFQKASATPMVGSETRRVGRPRQDWTSNVRKACQRVMGDATVDRLLGDRSKGAYQRWTAAVKECLSECESEAH